MLKKIFKNLLVVSNTYYGNSIGLAPIILSRASAKKNLNGFWSDYCKDNPSKINCLKYDC